MQAQASFPRTIKFRRVRACGFPTDKNADAVTGRPPAMVQTADLFALCFLVGN